jgi:hypothetical protein
LLATWGLKKYWFRKRVCERDTWSGRGGLCMFVDELQLESISTS